MIRRVSLTLAALLTLPACGSSAPAAVTTVVMMGGGRGTIGTGGAGGLLVAQSYGGPITVAPSGSMPTPKDLTFSAPSLGANPRTVIGQVSLTPVGGAIKGDDGATSATGLHVRPGAVLTLGATDDVDGTAGLDQVVLDFAAGVIVEGTVQTGRANAGTSAASWRGSVASLAVWPGGRILAVGDDGTAAIDGGAGGAIDLQLAGHFLNQGTIDARGGRGRNGGGGGPIDLRIGSGVMVNAGLATSDGGEGLAGAGGSAGGVSVVCSSASPNVGDLWNTGALLARGGFGTGGGGDGAMIMASACDLGEAYNQGELDASGGDATTAGPGGNAGGTTLIAQNAKLVAGGKLSSHGGRGAGAGRGGDGNTVGLVVLSSAPKPAGVPMTVHLGALVDASGGAGATGGRGGSVQLQDAANETGTSGLTLVGYRALDLTGGAGGSGGGQGGMAVVTVNKGPDAVSTSRYGSLSMDAAVDASGGGASAGAGGAGGLVDLRIGGGAPADLAYPSLTRKLAITAPVRAVGGAGSTVGGAGGTVLLFEHVAIEAAPLEVFGGAGGTAAGGHGGSVTVQCNGVARTAAITADGGPSSSVSGGAGGDVTLSSAGGNTVRGGVVSVRGGAGTPAAAHGSVMLDGSPATLTGGQLKP